jgi:hypothetical protein
MFRLAFFDHIVREGQEVLLWRQSISAIQRNISMGMYGGFESKITTDCCGASTLFQ